MVLQVGSPSWADGIACPSLDGLDPTGEAEALLARAERCMRNRGVIATAVVNEVFALMQLAVDDRPTRCQTGSPTSEEKAFRRRLAEKTRDLSRELTAALQPLGTESDGQGESPRAAVVLAAQHYSEMAHVMMARNNTGALLIAHNGLAKLLSARLPWLIGGVLDAPRLLSQLSRICCDGLDQLKMQLSSAKVGSPSGTEETKQANKFGRLLASFCALMSSLLRHLGPECLPPERRKAYELLAKTTAAVYPGVVALRSAEKNVSASASASLASSLPAVVAGRLYPQTKEAFLSMCGPPPCLVQRAGSGSLSSGGSLSTKPEASESTCRCFETSGSPGKGGGEVQPSWRGHDPWESLEALRPARTPGESRSGRTTEESRESARNTAVEGEGGSGESNGGRLPLVDTVGAVLLLCEALRSERKLSREVASRLLECCTWVLEHLAALFPGWVEAATAGPGREGGAGGSAGDDAFAGEAMAAVLCNEAGIALGLFVARRALTEDFEQAQIQLLEGCACHPHPLCREIWLKAFKAFLRRCDPTAQLSCVLTFVDAALDPRVCSRRRRRLARVLSACTTPSLLDPAVSGRFRQFLVSRLQQEHKLQSDRGVVTDAPASEFAPDPTRVGLTGGSDCGMKGAGALELLSGVSMRSFVDDDQELSVVSNALARTAVVSGLRTAGEESRALNVGGDRSNSMRGKADSLAAAVKFLAAGSGSGALAPEEAAREAKRALGLAFAGEGSAAQLSGRPLAAVTGLLAKVDPSKLPRLCSFMIEGAEEGRVEGEGLLALAEGLLSMGRQPFPSRPIDATIWEATLKNGFALLFGCGLWPVTTAAMQALEAMARHADPRTAELLPRLVPRSRLASFKARLSKKAVTLDGGHPIELGSLRERGWTEWRLLASAASALAEESKTHVSRASMATSGDSSRLHRQVVLRKGDNFNAMAGLLSYTIVDMELQSDEAGGGVRITLRGE